MTSIGNFQNILYSLLILAIWTAFVFLGAYPDNQGLGKMFSVSIYYILTLYAGLGLGLIVFCFRLFNLIKNKGLNFLYAFAGVLNLTLGIVELIVIGFQGLPTLYFLKLFLISLILGLIIIWDILFFKQ